MPFSFFLPTRLVFDEQPGPTLRREIEALALSRILLVSDPTLVHLGIVDKLEKELESAPCSLTRFVNVSTTPTIHELQAGLDLAKDQQAQAVLGLGGGSVLDLAKAVAMLLTNEGRYTDYMQGDRLIAHRNAPMFALPTTAGAGSALNKTTVIVDPDADWSREVSSPSMFPHTAVLDPDFLHTLPARTAAATGLSAFCQALEAYCARDADPFSDQMALDALRTAWTFLPRLVADRQDRPARYAMMLASAWAGIARDQAGTGLIAAISPILSAHLHLHFGMASAMVLPHAMRINLPHISTARRQRLTRLLGISADSGGDAIIEQLAHFVHHLGLPTSLDNLDIPLSDYDWESMAQAAFQAGQAGGNLRPLALGDCQHILDRLRNETL